MNSNDNLLKWANSRALTSIKLTAASKNADSDGLHQAAKLFRALANSDQVQAIQLLKITGEPFDANESLNRVIDNRTYDIGQTFPTFIDLAEKQGNHFAARFFKNCLTIAKLQAAILNEAFDNLNRLRETDYWVCQSCGHLETGDMPLNCKICSGSRENFLKIC